VRKNYWTRIRNSDMVPGQALADKRWVKGVVTSVGDADNFRLYHTPGLFWRWPLKFRRIPSTTKELKDETIHIRMAGVDAPEAPHFGKPGQPYAKEAREWLENTVLGKRLVCQLVFRDQYKRIVGVPRRPFPLIPSWLYRGRNVSLMMISAGFGTTYTSSNAEYGAAGLDKFIKLEEKAKKARRGMWASKTPLESPGDFKKRVGVEPSRPASGPAAPAVEPQKSGWLSSMFGRGSKSSKS